jgi:hypothetical protein
MLYKVILFDKVIIRVCIAMIRVYVFVLVHQAILAIYMKGHPSQRLCGVFLYSTVIMNAHDKVAF